MPSCVYCGGTGYEQGAFPLGIQGRERPRCRRGCKPRVTRRSTLMCTAGDHRLCTGTLQKFCGSTVLCTCQCHAQVKEAAA